MDDGSCKSKNSKAIILNTHNFTLKEVDLLCSILNSKFEFKAKPRIQKHVYKGQERCYFQIYISGHSFERMEQLVKEYIHPSMLYKWPSLLKAEKGGIQRF